MPSSARSASSPLLCIAACISPRASPRIAHVDMRRRRRLHSPPPAAVRPCPCRWKWAGRGLPHQSYVPRKPEPLGVESKTLSCVLSGILLFIELCEGKEAMHKKEFFRKHGATTACTLRCTENYWNSGQKQLENLHALLCPLLCPCLCPWCFSSSVLENPRCPRCLCHSFPLSFRALPPVLERLFRSIRVRSHRRRCCLRRCAIKYIFHCSSSSSLHS